MKINRVRDNTKQAIGKYKHGAGLNQVFKKTNRIRKDLGLKSVKRQSVSTRTLELYGDKEIIREKNNSGKWVYRLASTTTPKKSLSNLDMCESILDSSKPWKTKRYVCSLATQIEKSGENSLTTRLDGKGQLDTLKKIYNEISK